MGNWYNMYGFEVIGGLMSGPPGRTLPDSPRSPSAISRYASYRTSRRHRPVRLPINLFQRENLHLPLVLVRLRRQALHLREFPVLDLARPVPLQPRLNTSNDILLSDIVLKLWTMFKKPGVKKLQEDEMAKFTDSQA
ncbi:hypothetical protein Btru_068118 [Bulinus truncatus]|nr:hypothetical protein Btru_068118 [Bulinus truncatus]